MIIKAASDTAPDKVDGRLVRGQRRQTALVDAARDLFIKHGYRGTTLEAIIAQAGGSRETIYRVFGGKRGLFGEIIAQVGEKLAGSIVAPDALELAPREGLTRLAMQLIDVWQSEEGHAMNRVVLSEGYDAPELVEVWHRSGNKLSIQALAVYLEAQAKAGHLHPLDSVLVARQFVTLVMGEMAYPLAEPAEASVPTAMRVERCVEMVLRAYEIQST